MPESTEPTPQGGPTMLDRRVIEAETFLKIHAEASRRFGEQAALALLAAAVDADAREAGRRFATQAPHGPSLRHFSTILERWRAGGALIVQDVALTDDRFSFTVVRCAYADAYRAMGVPAGLAPYFSCRRDAAFVQGYDDRLRLERPEAIGEGGERCPFLFRWLG